ncbi:MAG TPA: transcription antitermination protein NusB [Bacilli bacterium]|nr:transcription antitermination protein NusB [Bacilli bacterium]
MISRNKSHEYGVQILYAALVYIKNGQTFDFKAVVSEVTDVPYDKVPDTLKKILLASLSNLNEIKEALIPYLKDWRFERLNEVTQAILIYSYAHFYYVGDVSKAIVINIAIKLAKLFIPNEDFKFINALLDEALK